MKIMKTRVYTAGGALLAGLAGSFLVGCQTPDLKPFRDSTAKIHDSVVEAQDVYSAELARLRPFVSDTPALAEQGKRFSTNWQARSEVMGALVRYAGSLAAVADAPDKSKAGLESVAQSLKELGAAAGPYQPAVEGATDIGIVLIDLANRVRAARQLKKAVLLTDPDIQRVARLLVQDFSRMRLALAEIQKSIRSLMNGGGMSRQIDTRNAVNNKVIERTEALQRKLGEPDWTSAVAQFNQEMAEAKKYLAEADKWYLPHQAAVEAAQQEMADRIKLFRDTETAITQWGKAHGDLAQALQNGLAPDWTLLRQSADRIEKNINKITSKDSKP